MVNGQKFGLRPWHSNIFVMVLRSNLVVKVQVYDFAILNFDFGLRYGQNFCHLMTDGGRRPMVYLDVPRSKPRIAGVIYK